MREAGDQAHSDRVHRQDENDWNRRCRLFDCDGRVSTSDNYIDFKAHELLRNLFEAFAAALCPVIFDRNVATFIPAEFAQPLHESGGPWFPGRWRGCTQKPDHRHRRLLRARRELTGFVRAARSQPKSAARSTPSARPMSAASARVNVSVLYQFVDTATRPWPTFVAPRRGFSRSGSAELGRSQKDGLPSCRAGRARFSAVRFKAINSRTEEGQP